MKIIIIYAVVIGILSVFATILDKIASKKHARRIPERTLLLLGAFGGALPMLITMKCIRHKTLHKKFMLGLPLLILLHAVGLVWVRVQFG
ncbi:MAG TPA: DUF1294 domain-containing protein [Ruminococcaceae bacterium]|nr:DUF1294 domain-containing protein [Oscillospiraceae bacterium]